MGEQAFDYAIGFPWPDFNNPTNKVTLETGEHYAWIYDDETHFDGYCFSVRADCPFSLRKRSGISGKI